MFDFILNYFCCRNRRIKSLLFYNKMKTYGNFFNYNKINYDYELADSFNELDDFVPLTQRNFWICSTIKLIDSDNNYFTSSERPHFDEVESETLLLHIKTNLVFNISGDLIGRLKISDLDEPYLVSVENMDQRLVNWFMQCKEITETKVN